MFSDQKFLDHFGYFNQILLLYIECSFISLNNAELADEEGLNADGAEDAIELAHNPYELIPYVDCIKKCEDNHDCQSFTYCPPGSSNLPKDQFRCHLKKKLFANADEASHKSESKCYTVFKKCEEGNYLVIYQT